MDGTYWGILLGSVGAGLLIAAGLAHLAARRAPLTAGLAAAGGLVGLAAVLLAGEPAAAEVAGSPELTVGIHARMYEFRAEYPGGASAVGDLTLPAGRRVRLELHASDVVHSLWLPDLGVRLPIVPGVPAAVTIRADEVGVLRLLCGEFCGPAHASMKGRVHVLPAAEFDAWLARLGAAGRVDVAAEAR